MASKQRLNYKYIANKVASKRDKVKLHIRNHGCKSNFSVTPSLVKYWWHVLNYAVFDGILVFPKQVVCRNFHNGYLGYCEPIGTKMDIRLGIRRQQCDKETFLVVLVHEMVHQYEWAVHKKMTHGKTFYAWQDRVFDTIGLPLNEYVE